MDKGYGKKYLVGIHLRIEGSYVIAHRNLLLLYVSVVRWSDADGGYNIRVCRSKTPDGPYYDFDGRDSDRNVQALNILMMKQLKNLA